MGVIDWSLKWRRITVDIPEPLMPLVEQRQKSVPYPSVSKYIFWTVVYELLLRKPHRFTPWMMRQTEKKQREFFEDLVNHFDDMKSPGSWMETRIHEEAIALIERGEADELVRERARKLAILDAKKTQNGQQPELPGI